MSSGLDLAPAVDVKCSLCLWKEGRGFLQGNPTPVRSFGKYISHAAFHKQDRTFVELMLGFYFNFLSIASWSFDPELKR